MSEVALAMEDPLKLRNSIEFMLLVSRLQTLERGILPALHCGTSRRFTTNNLTSLFKYFEVSLWSVLARCNAQCLFFFAANLHTQISQLFKTSNILNATTLLSRSAYFSITISHHTHEHAHTHTHTHTHGQYCDTAIQLHCRTAIGTATLCA